MTASAQLNSDHSIGKPQAACRPSTVAYDEAGTPASKRWQRSVLRAAESMGTKMFVRHSMTVIRAAVL